MAFLSCRRHDLGFKVCPAASCAHSHERLDELNGTCIGWTYPACACTKPHAAACGSQMAVAGAARGTSLCVIPSLNSLRSQSTAQMQNSHTKSSEPSNRDLIPAIASSLIPHGSCLQSRSIQAVLGPFEPPLMQVHFKHFSQPGLPRCALHFRGLSCSRPSVRLARL